MGDIGLMKQVWKWFELRKNGFLGSGDGVRWGKEKVLRIVDRHWPVVWRWCLDVWRVVFVLLLQWKESVLGGIRSLLTLGSAALFVVLWSFFVSFSSGISLLCVLLGLGVAGIAICYLGYTPGLYIVGLLGIFSMWMYGCFWIIGVLLISGGFMLSLNHARFLILLGTAYSLYFVNSRVGWHGIFLSLNLSFISNAILNSILLVYNSTNEGATHCEEQKESMPFTEDIFGESEYSPPTDEAGKTTSSSSSCKVQCSPSVSNTQNIASSSKVVKADSASLDEMKRIMNSSNHYEVMGFPRNKIVDLKFLKNEYRRKVLLVHPDKNMGNSLSSESFKKLQCAYEVLSDLGKKKDYDEEMRKEESGKMYQRSNGVSQQDGVEYRSEESRRIECTKCGNSHIWICTNRSKTRARWCQDCSQYHQAKDGDGWVENSSIATTSRKVEIPRAFVCAESKIFDVSEWAICQAIVCKPNTHGPTFHVNMVGLDTGLRSNTSRYPWSLDAEMITEDDEFESWLQQALASGFFSDSPKRRKSWSPFKLTYKSMKPWRRSP